MRVSLNALKHVTSPFFEFPAEGARRVFRGTHIYDAPAAVHVVSETELQAEGRGQKHEKGTQRERAA